MLDLTRLHSANHSQHDVTLKAQFSYTSHHSCTTIAHICAYIPYNAYIQCAPRTSLQKNKGTRHNREEDLIDTYRSLLRSTHGIEADDNLSPDRTETDTSSNDEGWDEETTLLEMLSIPYSKLFLLRT